MMDWKGCGCKRRGLPDGWLPSHICLERLREITTNPNRVTGPRVERQVASGLNTCIGALRVAEFVGHIRTLLQLEIIINYEEEGFWKENYVCFLLDGLNKTTKIHLWKADFPAQILMWYLRNESHICFVFCWNAWPYRIIKFCKMHLLGSRAPPPPPPPPAAPPTTTRKQLNGFSWGMTLGVSLTTIHSNFGWNRTKITGTLHEDLLAFLSVEELLRESPASRAATTQYSVMTSLPS
jgi:hypothetical protein